MQMDYPLTEEQRQIWQMEKAYPHTGIANVGGILRLDGKTDPQMLKKAIAVYVQTQSALWIKINKRDRQYFERIFDYEPQVFDFREKSTDKTEAVIRDWICMPFALYDSYLFEFAILRTKESAEVFGRFHHLITDSYALSLFAKEVEQIYEKLESGAHLPEADMQFQNKVRALYKSQEETGACETKSRKESVSFAARAKKPDAELLTYTQLFDYKEINTFFRRFRISAESLFYAALGICLCRLKSGKCLRIGRNLLNRGREECAMIALCVTTKPVDVDPDFESTGASYCAKLKKTLAAQTRGEAIGEGGYDIVVSYRPVRYLPAPKAGTCIEYMNRSVEVPLKFFLNDDGKQLDLIVKYQTEHIKKEEVQNLIMRVLKVMGQIVKEPEKPLKELEILSGEEKQFMAEWNDTFRWKPEKSLPQRYLEMVKAKPEQTVLIWQEETWSYRKFHRLVLHLADRIEKEADFQKGHMIGLCLKRTPRLPAAVYAAWLCGCGFLPVSIHDSLERKKKIAGECTLFLTDAYLDEKMAERSEKEWFSTNPEFNISEEKYDLNELADVPAYQMYTSGTTGEPKAVRISHRSLCCRLEWMQSVFGEGTDVILQKTRNTFDVSIWELVLPPAFGKTEVLLEDGKEAEPDAIAQVLLRERVTMVHFVPSMLEQFLEYAQRRKWQFPDLQYVICSGEALLAEQVKKAKKLLKNTEIYNLYGPTECTIDVSYYRCTGKESQIPIGRPVWNTHLTVQNLYGEVLPCGEIGELVIQGELVGMDYEDEAGEPQYHTGDLAVLSKDGWLYYLGRMDHQIKLRGMRVNLTEIEQSLERWFPGTRHIVLCIKEQLIDFYKGELTDRQIREKAAKALPYYEVPKAAVYIDEIPTGKHGKADRKELERRYMQTTANLATKSTFSKDWVTGRKERIMVSLAEKLMGYRGITTEDNLFAIGMDSLMLLRFLAQCESYGIRLAYGEVYANPTIRQLAAGKDALEPVVFLRNENEKTLLLMVPFAGGSPASFWKYPELLKEKVDLASLNPAAYGEKSVESIAAEVAGCKEIKNYQTVYLLGDCMGSALALELSRRMKKRMAGLIICESLPYEGFAFGSHVCSLWDFLTDDRIRKILRRLRGKDVQVGSHFLEIFRQEVRRSACYMRKRKQVLPECPVTLVFGEKDPLTANSQRKYRKWRRWIPKAYRIVCLAGQKHFFTEDAPEEVAKILKKLMREKGTEKKQIKK